MTFGDLLLRPLRGIPPIVAGDSLADIALAGLHRSNDRLCEGDALVFAQKIVSMRFPKTNSTSRASLPVEVESFCARAEGIMLVRSTVRPSDL